MLGKRGKADNNLDFGGVLFVCFCRFPSDDATRMAMKGLIWVAMRTVLTL